MNNAEREQWIDNDEGLYNWWRSLHMSKRAFIKENREELDACIERALHPHEPRRYEQFIFGDPDLGRQ